jgi:sterol desaturase/sphingolipid hydroxylase (fatty acid hydroxylase superfamily)
MHAQFMTFAVEVARLTAWLLLLSLVFVPLERCFAERPQTIWRRAFAIDLAYYFGNSVLTAALLASITAVLAVALRGLVPAALTQEAARLPFWPRVLAILVVSEFGTYWGHRFAHEIPLLWRFHAVHHSAEDVDWLSNTRGHPVDMIFTRLCGFLPLCLLGLAQPAGGEAGLTAPLVAVFTTFWGYFIHANLRWRFGWLEAIIATPAFHRWHHSNDSWRDRNYASTLPIYDRLFGTLHLPPAAWPSHYGIDAPMRPSLLEQLMSPFDQPVPAPRVVAAKSD